MGYEFCVDERVLVPRQDTEVLVEEAISRMRNLEKPQILDMCTGSENNLPKTDHSVSAQLSVPVPDVFDSPLPHKVLLLKHPHLFLMPVAIPEEFGWKPEENEEKNADI